MDPWGPSYTSPYPPYPPSQHPDDARRRSVYPQPGFQTAEPGFYSAALSSVGGFAPPPGPSSYMASPVSSYPPTPLGPPIPSMLKPGSMDRRPSVNNMRSNSNDFFFQGRSAFPMPQMPQQPHQYSPPLHQSHYPPPPPLPPQIRQSQSSPPPPLPAKVFDNPPLPPKPYGFAPPDSSPSLSSYPGQLTHSQSQRPPDPPPSLSTYPGQFTHSQSHRPTLLQVQSAPTIPDPSRSPFSGREYEPIPDEDADFVKALEMSARVEAENARKRQKTLTQEDEDVARALQESLQLSSFSMPMPAPSVPDIPSQPPASLSPGPSSYESHRFPASPPPSDSSRPIYEESHNFNNFTSSPPTVLGQLSDDEALSRAPSSSAHPPSFPYSSHDTPPMYNDVVAPATAASGSGAPPASPSLLAPASAASSSPSPGHSRPNSALGRSTSATAVPISASPSKQFVEVRTGRSSSSASGHSAPASPHAPSPHMPSPRAPSLHAPSPPMSQSGHDQNLIVPGSSGSSSGHSSSLSTVNEGSEHHGRPRSSSRVADAPTTAASPTAAVGANQYIDEELLRGISLGFNPPVIRANLAPLQGPIPNVIALPYGRCPPFHLKAPSWRDLIKLMARLSGTRLEPTIEAMALVKTEMRLRVVVNFVKVHQNTSDWHIVLYMTIDQPVPADHPQKYKYKNGDPNLLPFSYSMSATPAYLREGADAPISKWYSIPSTAGLPYPKLPITFPDLATYLLDALEDSRRVLHDGSGGLRRLAKLVETCYPTDRGEERPGRERGVSSWVRGLIGRERARSRDRNEHTFDVVTPFVPEEWGG